MSWEVFGAIGEVVGALAVVASLVYLAREVQHNTAVTQAEAFRTLTLKVSDVLAGWARDDAWNHLFHQIYWEGAGPEDLDPIERGKVSFHLLSLLRLFEAAYLQHREGIVPGEILEVADSNVFRTSYVREAWRVWRPQFTSDFARYFDSYLEELDEVGPGGASLSGA